MEEAGPNRLSAIRHRSLLDILWQQVKSLIVLLLVAAMAVSLATDQTVEAIAIAAVILINTAIGFITEWRAVRSIEALRKMDKVQAVVRRSGKRQEVDAEKIVPGDVVLLRQGDLVPADLRLLEVDALQVDESPLTGESMPVAKQVEAVDPDTELAERSSVVFKGTTVVRGTGSGLAVRTGMDSQLGEISAMVEETEQEEVHIEKKLDRLGRKLVWLTILVGAAVSVSGILAGRDLVLMLETGVALAVAAIPEGLPIVATIALARGMRRMLKRNALIRRLSSVETLGAATVICTDKTGTVTEGKMRVNRLRLDERDFLVSGSVQDHETGDEVDPEQVKNLEAAIRVSVLSSARDPIRDPMEEGLLELGTVAGFEPDDLRRRHPLEHEEPFNRETKMMATFNRADKGFLVAVKGAPEAVLEASTKILRNGEPVPLEEESRAFWEEEDDRLAEQGLRVLALAQKSAESTEDPFSDLCFIGYVAFLDPPREEIRSAIEECRAAGIRVVLVTGDHPSTAGHVAAQIGLIEEPDSTKVLPGRSLSGVAEADRDEQDKCRKAVVFGRTSPAQKLDLIELHQSGGEIVAMTGDGVNDAPALRKANIGIAMGKRGTDVARQAADMVLRDDRFNSIVTAVEQGRIIFANIRKFTVYLLSGNVGEILAVGAAAMAALPLPLQPLQILYLNMLNDVFPALALGVGPGIGGEMGRPPRDPAEAVLARRHWFRIGGYGVLIGATVLGAFLWALQIWELPIEESVTIAFLTLSISRLLHAFNMRRPKAGLLRNEITLNPTLWGAFLVCGIMLAVAVYLPGLSGVLKLTPPSARGWALIVLASFAPLLAGQVYLLAKSSK